jgi:hypothetical protein
LFEAVQPHCFRNTGALAAVILIVFQAADGSFTARQSHLEA